jgi:hypothetical protein
MLRCAQIASPKLVFVFTCSCSFRNSQSRLHGHDHEDAASLLDLFEQPATGVFQHLLA